MNKPSQQLLREMRKRRACKISFLFALLISAMFGTWVRAQTSPVQSFDVISIKPNHSINAGTSLGDAFPGHFTAKNFSLLYLMEYAYDVKEGQVQGLPSWANSEKYDINAKMDDATVELERSLPADQRAKLNKARVQSLFADRFGLKLHHAMKDMSILALTVARGGPKFTEAPATPAPGDPHPLPPGAFVTRNSGTEWIITTNQTPLRILITALSGQPEVSGRVLVDQTGLDANYSFVLKWTPQSLSTGAAAASDAPGPSLFTALQEQLGLRLESTKAPVDLLVVDHVEEPSAN